LAACIEAGFRVQLHGGYWDRFPATRNHAGGLVEPNALREAVCRAKVSLCLVRRANRDGHVMRTFELPAIGACMLTEDTEEHRGLFGADGENVVYFRTPEEAVGRLRWLVGHESERSRMSASAHKLVIEGKNTYRDRLETILAYRG
jgi:spore maturation protein CgeB